MEVSLVIPGRNAASTLPCCLDAVVPLLRHGTLIDIIFVDDGSTDETVRVARRYPIRVLTGRGTGPGAARNMGWRAAPGPLVWFLDSDCVAEPDALEILLEHLRDPMVVGAGGSYSNLSPGSLVATLIHEEIVERHIAMSEPVNFLASFNVLYRTEVLQRLGGFDERLLMAQDADLAYRIHRTGGRLAFDIRSRVGHFHPDRLWTYLQKQRHQGRWRVWLYLRHPRAMKGDSYSGWLDHIQPPLALLVLLLLPFWFVPAAAEATGVAIVALLLAQLPLTVRIVRRTRSWRSILFAPFSSLRAFARGVGTLQGAIRWLYHRPRRRSDVDPR